MESLLIYLVFTLVFAGPVALHWRRTRRREADACAAAERAQRHADRPAAQHPHVDVAHCIGCGGCVEACPEGDVLAVVGGTAAIVNPLKCVGHGLCAEACPVGAIEIVLAPPSMSADLPVLTPDGESNIENLFIVGELSGLALIKNAVNQGRNAVDEVARRLARAARHPDPSVRDVCVIGAGPAGLSASLRAIERGLTYVTLEQGELGGAVAHYPRRKLVMTSPVEFPLRGRLDKLEVSKEELLHFWHSTARQAGLTVRHRERVEEILRDDGCFTVVTDQGRYRARAVVLAIGRRGTPRRLGIPGEERPKVMYSLLDAEAYRDCDVLVVGGGDSAVEAALGLARPPGNRVTISYRRQEFSRIKERNARHLRQVVEQGRLRVLYGSSPVDVRERSVVLQVGPERLELANDYLWVFAGGTAPREFLERVGIRTGARDLIEEVAEHRMAGRR
ncbi:MAG TPA: NAD(P)-binding domain-containing protein [Gemmatimonadales bacterium]|nr:NAD(P)-binding domain-containing protein [Gemmatimonadales bacterium]